MSDNKEKEIDGPVFNGDEQIVEEPRFRGGEWEELSKTLFMAILIAVVIRTLVFEPFNIPSGSMKPNLLVGDFLFVTKYSYGYSMHSVPFSPVPFEGRIYGQSPERGDVAVFKLPTNTRTDYIKRVVGLPGDTVQMIGGRLYINGTRVPREKIAEEEKTRHYNAFVSGQVTQTTYRETLPNGVSYLIYEESDMAPLDNTPLYTVPKDHFFMMGDNRDNSQDSRVSYLVGPVPYKNFVGRAERIFFSLDQSARIWELWKWPFAIRYERLFGKISP